MPRPHTYAVTLALSEDTRNQHKQHTHESPHPPHRVPRQHHIQTKGNHMTTHIPSSKSERNIIMFQVNIKGIKNKTRGAQTVYSQHICKYHHNSEN